MAHFNPNDMVPFHDQDRTVLRMGQLIGSGSQADVYLALDILQNRYVAAKHCYGNYANNRELFYKKVRALARHDSPHPDLCWPANVSPLTKEKSFLFTMPLLEGYRPLTGVITGKDGLTMAQKVRLLYDAADILRSLHEKKFVYGDISDRNILYRLEPDGRIRVKFVDCENITLPGFSFGLQGTGKYRAPELLLPDPDREDGHPQAPSIHSDAFAFQVLAFRVLLRRHPLDGELARSCRADDHEGFLEYYARQPRFIFDGNLNPPGPEVTKKWKQLPALMQVYFQDCFCQRSLHHKQHRSGMEELRCCLSLSYPL